MTQIPTRSINDLETRLRRHISRSNDLRAIVLDGHGLMEQAIDSLITENLANPSALEQAQLTVAQRIRLCLALVPMGSLDHVLRSTAALGLLYAHIGLYRDHSQCERHVIEFLRLAEDAEPEAIAIFESEAITKRLQRIIIFLCAEICGWGRTNPDRPSDAKESMRAIWLH